MTINKSDKDMNSDIDGIIISGKVYEAIPRGLRHCSDCDLFDRCDVLFTDVCAMFSEDMVARIFRYSQTLTDKINKR